MPTVGQGKTTIPVVVTLPLLQEFVERIGGDRVEVTSLLTGLESGHTYEPSLRDILAIRRARVLVVIGAGLEVWIDGLIRNAAPRHLTVITTSRGIPLLQDHDRHAAHPARRRPQRLGNPHIWLDTQNAAAMLKQITNGLLAVDPEGRAAYLANQASYLEEIDRLERTLQHQVLRLGSRRIITHHPAWPYFSRRFGLEIRGVILSNDGAEPSPKQIAALIKQIKAEQIRVVVAEPQLNPGLPALLARETGARVVLLTPLPGGIQGTETYVSMMQYNVDQLVAALEGPP